jgi:hypothetical protein
VFCRSSSRRRRSRHPPLHARLYRPSFALANKYTQFTITCTLEFIPIKAAYKAIHHNLTKA